MTGQSWVSQKLFLDSPFTGLAIGYVIGHGAMFLPSPLFFGSKETPLETPDPKLSSVSNLWIHFENSLDDLKKGCCGAPLFNKDGYVYGVSINIPLVDAGYALGSFKYDLGSMSAQMSGTKSK